MGQHVKSTFDFTHGQLFSQWKNSSGEEHRLLLSPSELYHLTVILMSPTGTVWCYKSGSPPVLSSLLCIFSLFHSVPYFAALLDVLSEFNLSLFLWPAQLPSYEPLSVWSDFFFALFFSSSCYRSLTVLHLLFHSILVSTPLLLLCSLSL